MNSPPLKPRTNPNAPPDCVYVFLDTSILRREIDARGSGLRHLQTSVEKGAVRVLVPELVLRELTTGLASELMKWAAKAQESQRAISWCLTDATSTSATLGLKSLLDMLPNLDERLKEGIDQRMKELNALILPVTENASRAAWDMYFTGSPPMKQPKCRTDIPDAFIVACAREAQSQIGCNLHVIASDAALLNAFPKEHFTTHSSLGAFNSSDDVKLTLQRLEIRDEQAFQHWRERAKEAVIQQQDSIESVLGDSLWSSLHNQDISSIHLPSSDQEARLTGDATIDEVDFRWSQMDYLGRTAILVPATIYVSDALVDIFIDKSNYWGNEDVNNRFRAYDSDWNDHTVAANGYLEMEVEALIRVDLEEDEHEEVIVSSASIEEVRSIELSGLD